MKNRHIYEGWTVMDFIKELGPTLAMIMDGMSHIAPLKTKEELKQWTADNQPYYKKVIPEVVNHFATLYNLK